jgi:outer membrane protein TolC
MVVGLLVSHLMAADTLELRALQRAAVEHDPRARELALQERATGHRLANLRTSRLPALTFGGEATHQSEVPAIPLELPGVTVPIPPKDRYEASVGVEQLLYDSGALNGQRKAEEARLAEEQATVRAALYPLRAQVNEAFYGALALQERLSEIATLTTDLEARLELVRAQAREGAALPGDTAVVKAELLRAEQSRSEAAAGLRAALAVLSDLSGRSISEGEVLALPELADAVGRIRSGEDGTGHPRYAVYRAQRESLAVRAAALQAETGPRVSAFGRWAYGRPGYEQFTDQFHDYWMAGIRVQWQPWNWRKTEREQEALGVQSEIVSAEEAAFRAGLRREVEDDEATMERLEAALASDATIIELRAQVERQARAQLEERAITPAAYVSIRRDLQEARLAERRHRVELSRARAGYLTTIGEGLQ